MGDKGLVASSQKVQQDERLSKKHIQTLGYVQELMKENKKLTEMLQEYEQQKLHCDDLHAQNDAAQAKIKMIQEQCLARADEIAAALVKKHTEEQNKLKEDKLNAERRLETVTKEMALEIERLQKLNSSLEDALKAKAGMAANQKDLREQAEQYKQQIDNLQRQVMSLSEANENQLREMKKMDREHAEHKAIKEKLVSANQTIKELEGRVKQLESELATSNASLTALQDNEMKSYKSKLIKALNEVSNLEHQVNVKDAEIGKCKENVVTLMEELETVQTRRYGLQREVEALKREIVDLKQLIAKLKAKSEDGGTFKDFVAVKRELATLQEENNSLKERLSSSKTNSSAGKSASKQKINLKLRQ